jgi:hypothetical protein
MNPARLPDELVDVKPRLLSDLREGETGYVSFTALRVTSDRQCFARITAELFTVGGFITIQVTRGANGALHVSVPEGRKYLPGELLTDKAIGSPDLVPVASITVGKAEK